MITIKQRGNFKNTERFLSAAQRFNVRRILEGYGWEGVKALSMDTPKDTGETANSWDYNISITSRGYSITWVNNNLENQVPVAILLQYGHATRSGTYIRGIDYINPAIRPIFEKISESIMAEVNKL